MYGVWKYFTVNDDDIDLRCKSYLTVGTLESYSKIRDYFGRLIRAIHREKGQQVPKYEEMCRRFLADASDFSEEKLHEAGITHRFVNDDMDTVLAEISAYIQQSS